MTGRLDLQSGRLALDCASDSAPLGVRLVAQLDAKLESRPPTANFSAESVVECSSRGGSLVAVDASATTDPDEPNSELSYRWYVDDLPAGSGRMVDQIFVPLGQHTLHLRLMDSDAFVNGTERTLEVRDTRPPEFTGFFFSGSTCLWPPNHKYTVLDLQRDVRAQVQDVCDPEPTLRFGSVTSSQPDNGSGDGDTSGDVVEFADHVYLRTERQGVAIAGRRYVIEVHAIDASGNAGDPTIEVEVPHDRGPDGCTPMRANEFADEGSERTRRDRGALRIG